MRILVVGAGAIGGYFGGRLIETGQDVTFLVRLRRAAQLATNGLIVQSPLGNIARQVPTITAETLTSGYDAILLSCKAYDLDDAIASLTPAVTPQTAILPLLNGMKHLETLSARFGPQAVLGGQCQIAATLDPDGTIRHLGELAALSLGEQDGALSPRVQALGEAVAKCGGKPSTTILQDMWEKWVFLASLAALTCLMRAPVADIVEASGAPLATAIFDEAAQIAKANNHPPREAFTTRMRAMIAKPGLVFSASMMRDIEAGNRIEADHIIADLIARAPPQTTPLLQIALTHLKTYEARKHREAHEKALSLGDRVG